jgi:predicted nuclease of predicted toxin-antitoxin system
VKLLLDQGLSRSTAAGLVRLGHDAVHAGDIGMAAATDRELIERARRDGRVIVTLDADFHSLLALANASSPSTVGA